MGEEFSISKNYSMMYLVTWATMTYSSAMPVLYLFGFLYFFTSYYIERFLIFKYYRKSKVFNEQIPINTSYLFRWALVFHCLFSFMLFSNNQIFYSPNVDLEDFGYDRLPMTIIEKSYSDVPLDIKFLNQPQNFTEPIREIYGCSNSFVSRLLQPQVIILIFIYFLTFFIYFYQEKVEVWVRSFV